MCPIFVGSVHYFGKSDDDEVFEAQEEQATFLILFKRGQGRTYYLYVLENIY